MLKYKIIAAVILSMVVFGGLTYWRLNDIAHWKAEGRAELQAEIDKAKEEANTKTIAKQQVIKQKTQEKEYVVRKEKGADAPASSYLRGVLDRMRSAD